MRAAEAILLRLSHLSLREGFGTTNATGREGKAVTNQKHPGERKVDIDSVDFTALISRH
jgi:hypothetical protein